jgi:hypothetical protein
MMEKHEPGKIIPEQHLGIETNTESERVFESEKQAMEMYGIARERLMQPNQWHDHAGQATADFQLTDHEGNPVSRIIEKGDHFRIDIPAPGSSTGDGYDWVQVEEIEEGHGEDGIFTAIRVRPATNPQNNKDDVAHFFTDDATSSFIVKLKGEKVIAGVYGRNEKPNIEADALLDKARNTAVAAGAISGFAKLQWKSLVDGLLKDAE